MSAFLYFCKSPKGHRKTTWFFIAMLCLFGSVKYSGADFSPQHQKNRKINFLNPYEEKNHSLFQWRKEEFRSLFFEWGTLIDPTNLASSPPSQKEDRSPFFPKDSFWYFHVEQPTFLLPYFIKWGVRASVGMAQKKKKNNHFFLFTLSHVWSVEFFQPQFVVPFVEVGASIWNRQSFMKSFSEIRPFFSLGATFSFSILKPSLNHTLRDEYNILDMGVIVQLRTMKTHKAWFYPKDSIRFVSVGLFVHL